jgi:hypothetical protein
MKATIWFRISAVLMFLFAAGHTFGFLAFRPPTSEGRAVWDAMNNVGFTIGHSTFTYGGFYLGFGLSITASQLFLAWLAWFLGSICLQCPSQARAIAWALFVMQFISFALSVKYFSLGPASLSVVAAICFAMAATSISPSISARAANAD